MRLVFPRAASARTLLVAAAAAALVTTVLLTAFVQYASLLPLAGVRAALFEAPVVERTLLVSASAGDDAAEVTARDDAVRGVLEPGLATAGLEVSGAGYAVSQQLPAEGDADALVTFLSDLDSHAELVDGQWPRVAGEDEPVQAAVPAGVADELGYAAGDELVIHDGIDQEDRPVVVTGVWRADDPDAAYWQLVDHRLDAGLVGPFVVHPDEYVARYRTLGTQLWLAEPDPAELAEAGIANVTTALDALQARLLEQRATDPALGENARIITGMDELGARLALATVVNRSGLVLPAALLAVIAGYGLMLVARLLAAHRRGENALLRARGASRRQLVRYTVAEALLVVAPAALLAAPAASWLVSFADRHAGARSLGVAGDLAPYGLFGPPLAWIIALAAAAGCAVALALPAASRGRTWVAEQQERSRPGKLAAAQRAGTDVALVALAVLAWTQLRQYGSAVTPRDLGGLGVDPLLVAAPVVGVLAATAVALRLLPLATRWGVRLAGRRDTFPGLLGMWQADRRPHAGPVLLLVLAVGTAVLAPSVATTWQQSQRDQAAQLVGADLRIQDAAGSTAGAATEVIDSPQVAATMPVERSVALLPEGVRTTMLALDSEQAAEVTRVRDDLADAAPEEVFARLHEQRPELEPAPLPEGAQRLTGEVEFEGPEPVRLAPSGGFFTAPVYVVSSHRLWIYTVDRYGVISALRSGLPEPGGDVTEIDVALPPATVGLVGLGAGMTVQTFGEVDGGEAVYAGESASLPDPGEVSWRWELAAAGGPEGPVAVQPPGSWDLHYPDGQQGGDGPPLEVSGDGIAVTTQVDPTNDRGSQQPFLLAGPLPEPGPVPGLVTPDVLAATGAEVGQVIGVGSADLEIVGTIGTLPGTADGSGLAVDLSSLSTQQFQTGGGAREVNEWWLATTGTEQVAADAAAAGLDVLNEQAEARRLLDDPLGAGVLVSLWTAAAAAALLAAFGLVVDARANAVRRGRELAVLHTLGASPPALARALVVEQAVLAGLGVLAGVAVGVGVAAAMGTSLVLTPSGSVPVPEPLLTLSPAMFAVPTVGLFVVAVVLGAMVARRARRDIVAGALRIGED